GLSINVTVPAGVTDAYVIVRDSAAGAPDCYPGSQARPVYYTIRTTTVGNQTLVLPPNLGPTGPGAVSNTRSICTGDSFRVYAVGFNYGETAAAYPFSTSQTPAITGANGQADITSSPFTATTVY
ncbi:MAG: hypothetical protein GIW95_07140, partial [Candidatus Eremiobacteraeota bacterium]|nr:hypothetical protein [Candidatus Eremiobacteraeota bacterium]